LTFWLQMFSRFDILMTYKLCRVSCLLCHWLFIWKDSDKIGNPELYYIMSRWKASCCKFVSAVRCRRQQWL
jgi:hypothetical protein